MADQPSVGGCYTPNRKPRRGTSCSSIPLRDQNQSGSTSSPATTTSTTSVHPVSPPLPTPTEPIDLSLKGLRALHPPVMADQTTSSFDNENDSANSEAFQSPLQKSFEDSPQDRKVTSISSAENFLTPTSTTTNEETIEDSPIAKSTPNLEHETKVEIGRSGGEESTSGPGSTSAPPDLQPQETATVFKIPEKPPRKVSTERPPKVYEPKVEATPTPPRSSGDPPTSVEIQVEPKTDTLDDGDHVPEDQPQSSAPSSRPDSANFTSGQRKPGFAHGLGGPVGKPAYGVGSRPTGEEDDPWPTTPIRGRPSISQIKEVAKGFSGRQWVTLVVFGVADLFSAMVMSLQAPFYPPEAEKKGATATEYGLVFGIYELIVFVTSPLFGKYMNKLGPRFIFNSGIAITAISCICFGFLDRINDHTWFISLSFALRITEALGASAFVTSAFTIIACEFPESVATTFASLETFFGLGLIIGPSVGGALFQLGGFVLPFLFTGVGLLLVGVASFFIMPKIETVSDEEGNRTEGYGIFSILRIPGVAVAAIALMLTMNSIGFLSATLEPHLRQFSLSPLQVGLMFIIDGGIYALTAPGFGWICDRLNRPLLVTLVGALLSIVGFLFIGPAPFIPLDTLLWMTGVGLGILGLGIGATLVSGFISALRDSMELGYPDNISTYGVVSGLWTSAVSLGAFLGPSIGGFLLDTFNFRNATYYIFGTQTFLVVLLIVYLMTKHRFSLASHESESEPLLSPITPSNQGLAPKQMKGLTTPFEVVTPSTSGYGAMGDS